MSTPDGTPEIDADAAAQPADADLGPPAADDFDRKAERARAQDELADALGDIDEDGEELFVDGTVGRSDLAAERDEYLDALRRVKAEFDNFKKRTEKERLQTVDRAAEAIVRDLLPVVEACDAAVAHGDEGAIAIRALLFEVLGKGGLEKMEPVGKPFDPMLHEAVLQEVGDGPSDEVVEVMRPGYTWRGRVLQPAMVKVRA